METEWKRNGMEMEYVSMLVFGIHPTPHIRGVLVPYTGLDCRGVFVFDVVCRALETTGQGPQDV